MSLCSLSLRSSAHASSKPYGVVLRCGKKPPQPLSINTTETISIIVIVLMSQMAEVIDSPRLRNRVTVFRDRFHAGELLAEKLRDVKGLEEAIIFAIPAGGVQVAKSVSEKLSLPFDLAVTRKLHVPWNREAGFGAISWDGFMLLNEPLGKVLGLTGEQIERCVAEEKKVIERRLRLFRDEKPFPSVEDKAILVVDDGLASGFSMLTTLRTLQLRGAGKIVVGVPTAHEGAIELIRPSADVIVCLNVRSSHFFAVADAYESWYDLDDDEVSSLLKESPHYLE
jgi:predicted phosphoribosyltransferase